MNAPPYRELLESGELARRVERALALRETDGCELCPNECRVHKDEGERGVCGVGNVVVSSVAPHFGEEPCLVGDGGSGTIFFAGCNLHCAFCQNYDISRQPDSWRETGTHELASYMLSLQSRGTENLNLVTPSHLLPEILGALAVAAKAGLRLPLVYNSSGYDRVDALALLDGVVSIYLPDFKFFDNETAGRFSRADDYPDVAKAAIREMHRQVGDLVLDDRGIAERGLLVRHLVLPNGFAGTEGVVRYLAEEISPRTCINVMDQFFPAYRARSIPELNRRVSREEYLEARHLAEQAGLRLVEDL